MLVACQGQCQGQLNVLWSFKWCLVMLLLSILQPEFTSF
jgi:hypothetical protein